MKIIRRTYWALAEVPNHYSHGEKNLSQLHVCILHSSNASSGDEDVDNTGAALNRLKETSMRVANIRIAACFQNSVPALLTFDL